ncbi:MAG: COX15/CtaA family protein [Chloroflexi bacterium]|nr:COX15/CtaA family protein [Chloroflexota bacterium]
MDTIARPGSGLTAASNDRLLLTLLGLMVIGAIIQITLGGVVRVTESGLGCPDWPLCHGSLIPKFEYHTMIEWSHRTAGSSVGLVFIAAVIRVWLIHRDNRFLVTVTTGSLVLITIVGGIGGAVVLSEVEPALRTLHLGLAEGVVLFSVLAFAAAATGWTQRRFSDTSGIPDVSGGRLMAALESAGDLVTARRVTNIAAVLALATLLSGSYAVWRGAGAVCPSWPLCGGSIIPESELVWIHATHRVFAGVSTVVALWAAHRAYRLSGGSQVVRLLAVGALVTVVGQVLVGAANPWTDFSEWAQAIHLSLATIMWTDLVLLAAVLLMQPYGREAEPARGAEA